MNSSSCEIQDAAAAKRPATDAAPCISGKKRRSKNADRRTSSNSIHDGQSKKLRVCASCAEPRLPSEFSARQRKKGGAAKCRDCIIICAATATENANDAGKQQATVTTKTMHKCRACRRPKHRTKSFSPEELAKGANAKCNGCMEAESKQQQLAVELKVCTRCWKLKKLADFPKSQRAKPENALCKGCWHYRQVPRKMCGYCSEDLPLYRFHKTERMKEAGTAICDDCLWVQSEEDEEDRRLVERDRQLRHQRDNAPRRCKECGISKRNHNFPAHPWERLPLDYSDIVCLECLPQIQAANWTKAKEFARSLEQKDGAVVYGFPDPDLLESTYGTKEPEGLEGAYEIVFNHDYRFQYGRSDPGTLTLTRMNDGDDGESRFSGKLEFQKPDSEGCKSDLIMTNGRHYPSRTAWKLEFEVHRERSMSVYDRRATFHVITERIALPWEPTLGFKPWYEGSGFVVNEEIFGNSKLVQFGTNEEAEALLQRHNRRCSGEQSWTGKHLPLTADIAKHIHQYARSWIPPPVLFLEPGDLVLTRSEPSDPATAGYETRICDDCDVFLRKTVEPS